MLKIPGSIVNHLEPRIQQETTISGFTKMFVITVSNSDLGMEARRYKENKQEYKGSKSKEYKTKKFVTQETLKKPTGEATKSGQKATGPLKPSTSQTLQKFYDCGEMVADYRNCKCKTSKNIRAVAEDSDSESSSDTSSSDNDKKEAQEENNSGSEDDTDENFVATLEVDEMDTTIMQLQADINWPQGLDDSWVNTENVQDASILYPRPQRGQAHRIGKAAYTRVLVNNKIVQLRLDTGAACSIAGHGVLMKVDPNYQARLMPINNQTRFSGVG